MRRYLIPPAAEAASAVLWPCVISRAAVFAVAAAASIAARAADVPGVGAAGRLHHLLERWDAIWYLDIAAHGYRWNPQAIEAQQNVVFFPLYPWLTRAVGFVLGGHLTIAGAIVSGAAFFAACVQVWRFAAAELTPPAPGDARRLATRAVVMLCAYPFAIYFGVVYTESLFLLLIASAFLAARGGRFGTAAVCSTLAGLTRPNGVVLSLPIAWIAAHDRTDSPLAARAAAVAGPIAGVALYSMFLDARVGDPLAWLHGQAAWHWISPEATRDLAAAARHIDPVDAAIALANLAAAIVALAAVARIYRLLGGAAALLVAASVGIALVNHGLLSMGRFTSILFPLFVWLAWATREGSRFRWIAIGFGVGEAAAAALFFAGRPMV